MHTFSALHSSMPSWIKMRFQANSRSKARTCVTHYILAFHFNIFVFWVLWEIFLPRTTGYDGCWLAGKTRGRNERCYGDLRPLDDALARAAGTPPRTKCISFRCSLGFFVLVPIGIIRPFYTTPCEYHTTWHRPVYSRLFFLTVL